VTVPLSAGSPRREHARRFGAALREAQATRRIGQKTLGPQVGVATSAISSWRAGQNLPTLKTALRLSEALQWPELYEIARDARTGVCPIDGVAFVNEGGKPKVYCGSDCRDVASRRRAVNWQPDADLVLATTVEQLLHQTPVRKKPMRAAIAAFRATRGRATQVRVERRLSDHQAAVEAFCRSCEWDGFCKTPDCELRPVSPLPLEPRLVLPGPARPAEGAWGGANRPAMVAVVQAAARRRWARPGEHELQAERSRRWWEGLTPAERVAHGRRIAEARRGKPSTRDCGCPNRKHIEGCLLRRTVTA
jgi:DNA-binding XRE family transcriptional regulator